LDDSNLPEKEFIEKWQRQDDKDYPEKVKTRFHGRILAAL
jgi:hypothetical protein